MSTLAQKKLKNFNVVQNGPKSWAFSLQIFYLALLVLHTSRSRDMKHKIAWSGPKKPKNQKSPNERESEVLKTEKN
jgi:hypothetical protein